MCLMVVLAESQVFIRVEFDEMVGPEGVARAGRGFGCGGDIVLRVVGEGRLVAQGSLKESVSGVSLAGTSDSAASKAAELGRVDRITGHGYVDHVGACKDRSWEGGREA